MLAIVLYCLIAAVLCYLVGTLVLVRLGAHQPDRPADAALAACWIGLAALAAALLVLAFVAPLTPLSGLLLAAALAALALADPRVRERSRLTVRAVRLPHLVVAAVLVASVALFSSIAPIFYDTAMYQYAESQWLAAFGVVRGLALFQNRLGTISPWYALPAPLDHGVFRARMINAPMAIALWFALLGIAAAMTRWAQGRERPADRFMALAVGGWVLRMLIVQQPAIVPSPDLAWSVLMLLSVWAWLVERDAVGDGAVKELSTLPLLFAAAAAGVRFNALPAAGCAWLFYVYGGERKLRRALVGAAIGAAFVLPEIVATFRTSGCPLFPTALLCVDRPWALGAQHAREYGAFVRWFARANEGRLDAIPPTPDGAGWAWWLPVWIRAHHFVIGAAIVTALITAFSARSRRAHWRSIGLLGAAVLACIAVTFVVAPANRFLVPYVLIVPSAGMALLSWPRRRPAVLRGGLARYAVMAALAIIVFARSGFHPRGLFTPGIPFSDRTVSSEVVLPGRLRKPDSLYTARSGALSYYTPAPPPATYRPISLYNSMDARCWDAPFPCTSQLAAPGVTLASPARGLGAGFVKGSASGATSP